jgi:eukaryotic-like serine/threonine-protein kinase
MATVHLGRLLGPVGFSRTVAIKKLHSHLLDEPEFVPMFLDEARLAARIRHPNVVATLDVVEDEGELLLVMEYVQGETLSRLLGHLASKGQRIPLPIVGAIFSGVLRGLHAAHEAKGANGELLGVVHRDVSPQNIMVGLDGIPRVLDFGVAKASGRLQTTRTGQVKGKLAYMAPEQVHGGDATRQSDVYALAVVLWESLSCRRLFHSPSDLATVEHILAGPVFPPSTHAGPLPPGVDELVLRGVDRDPRKRFATARDMAVALERLMPLAIPAEVGEWLETIAGDHLSRQAARVAQMERGPDFAGTVGDLPAARSFTEETTQEIEVSPHSEIVRVQAFERASVQIDAHSSDVKQSHVRRSRQSTPEATLEPDPLPHQRLLRRIVAIVMVACLMILMLAAAGR